MIMSSWWSAAAACLLLLTPVPAAHASRLRNYHAHDYYAVQLSPTVDPRAVSTYLGLHYEGPLGELADHHVFRANTKQLERDDIQHALQELKNLRRKRGPEATQPHILDNIHFSQKQELHTRFPLVKRQQPLPQDLPVLDGSLVEAVPSPAQQLGIEIAERLNIADPIFHEQWHLYNDVEKGHDINVTGVWEQGITGKGSTVCIVDDGLDLDSDDLRDNYFGAGSYDFNDQVEDPKPRLPEDRHGTRCAGEVAAVRNNVCGVGVAYNSRIAGVRILSKVITDADEAASLNYAYQDNDIYSCSWGPPDDGQSMDGPGILIRKAMVNGVQKGRRGLGSIFVFAIGNGAAFDDNCNFDGYTNSIYSISVGAIDRAGLRPYYSEKCSAQLIVSYSSGSGDAIHTTDVGEHNCYGNHGGTSAAGPLVAGIYALVLEVNPHLTWRDIQWLTVLTAIRINQPGDWTMNKAVGKEFSHEFGYGKADAWAMVEMAKNWTNLKPQAWFYSPWLSIHQDIPQGDRGLASSFEVTQEMLKMANLERVEHVTVTMNVEHTRRGDLSVELRSPSGMVSHIATTRRNDEHQSGYVDWTFMSVAHWGEDGIGKWTVIVKDTNVNDHSGKFVDWHLKLWGECIDPALATPLPLPSLHDDDHEDVPIPTVSATAGLTSVVVPSQTGQQTGNPTDHPNRPVRPPKPTHMASTATDKASPSPTEQPFVPPAENEEIDSPVTTTTNPTAAVTTSTPSSPTKTGSNFLPRPFPTFGVSKRTQVWIYGAVTIIAIFLIALGTWWYCVQRRRRRWMTRGDYGFEMIDHDGADGKAGDADEGVAMLNGRGGKRKKRAGELYDAFAEGDSEDDFDDDDDDDHFDLGAETDEDDDSRSEDFGGRRKEAAGNYRDEEPSR